MARDGRQFATGVNTPCRISNIFKSGVDTIMAFSDILFKESSKRALAKTLSYRVLILILDFSFIYIITRKVDISAEFTIGSNIYSTLAYYFHERAWDRVKWGKLVHKKARA